MNIVFLGSGAFGLNCLDAINCSSHNLALVITQPARASGRGKKIQPTAVADWAKINNISCKETSNINSPESVDMIKALCPDLIVVIAFGQKISQEVTSIAPKSAINVHSSLLPKYRGAAPINWSIINGDTTGGVSIITVADKMDSGDILAQKETAIAPNETAGQLHDRLALLSTDLLLNTIDAIEKNTAIYTEQNHAMATSAPKLKKSDGYIDFTDSAGSLHNKVRGLFPWPSASCHYTNNSNTIIRVVIEKAAIIDSDTKSELAAGTLDNDLNIVCGTGLLKIEQIKPAGKKTMAFDDFVNGYRVFAGDNFSKIEPA